MRRRPVSYEHDEQVGVINELLLWRRDYPELWGLYAVPNAGSAGKGGQARSAIMQDEGAKAGVSDLVLPVPRWRVIKSPKSILTWGGIPKSRTHGLNLSIDGANPFYMGLYVEMKRAPTVSPVRGAIRWHQPSPEQQEFLDFVRTQGYVGACANGKKEALVIFKWYLGLPRIPAPELQTEGEPWKARI